MSIETFDTFQLGKKAKVIAADPKAPVKIINCRGATVHVNTTSAVTKHDAQLRVGESFETDSAVWLMSEVESTVMVDHL